MIPRLNRLSSARLIASKIVPSSNFSLRYVKNTLSYNRFAFVVGKKIDKRAVVRNKLKRVLRELIFKHSLRFSGVDMVIIVKNNFTEAPSLEIEKEVIKALSAMHL